MKPVIGFALIVLVFLAGAFYYFSNSPKTPTPASEETTKTVGDKKEVDGILTIDSNLAIGSDSAITGPGSYEEYSQKAFGDSAGKRKVLFFHASWCPTCRPADTEFKSNLDKIPGDLVVFKVNYNDPETDDEDRALAAKYGITYQHTYVQIDDDGKEIKKWNGGSLDKLLSQIQ